MATRYALKIDARQVEKLAGALESISGSEVSEAAVAALNIVVDKTYDLARQNITSGINIDDAYLRRKMTVTHATQGKQVATISASGDRDSLTVLGRYGAKPIIVSNRTRRPRLGNAKLGISPGSKQQGVSVSVTRGSSKAVERGFLMPLMRGSEAGGNGMGVFARTRAGVLKHRYGPSVYQLFSYQANAILGEVTDDLENTLVDMVEMQIKKALSE